MAVAEMTQETLDKLNQEGFGNEDTTNTIVDTTTGTPNQNQDDATGGNLPDIEFNPDADGGTADQNQGSGDKGSTDTAQGSQKVSDEQVFDPFVTKKIEAGGFKVEDVKARMLKDGGITPEFAEELKKTIDPDLVDTYVAGLNTGLKDKTYATTQEAEPDADLAAKNAKQQELNTYIYDSVGGKDKFEAMAGALKANLPAEAIDVLNAKLASPNKALIAEGMKEAVNQYKQLTGRTNNRMEGTPTGPDGKAFEFMTKAQYQKAIHSEKYGTDPAYAKQVDEQRMKSMQLDAGRTMPGQYRAFRDGVMYDL